MVAIEQFDEIELVKTLAFACWFTGSFGLDRHHEHKHPLRLVPLNEFGRFLPVFWPILSEFRVMSNDV